MDAKLSSISDTLHSFTPPAKVAHRDKRVYNCVFDGILIFLITCFILGKPYTTQITLQYHDWIVSSIVVFCYYFAFEALFGKTPGKFITKTKVVANDGKPLSSSAIAIRNLYRLVPFEFVSFAFNSHPVGWHDKFSNTVVIDESIGNTKNRTIEVANKIIKTVLYVILGLIIVLLLLFGGLALYRAIVLHNI